LSKIRTFGSRPSAGGTVINFPFFTNLGLKIGTTLSAIIGNTKVAGNVSQSPSTLLVSEKAAGHISQVNITLLHGDYVVTGSNDTGNVQNWTNPTNVQGAPNASFATFAGGAILESGVLRGTHVAQTSRPSTLIIDKVFLDFYGKASGLPVVSDLVSNLTLRYRINTSPVAGQEKSLQAISTGTADFSVTPLTFRIDDVANGVFNDGATPALSTALTWANIALVQSDWSATTILGLVGALYSADAVKLRVEAHEVWIP
jgi:hypothetical protein